MATNDDVPERPEVCPMCGRELWSDGLPPAQDGNAWIGGDCDQARNRTSGPSAMRRTAVTTEGNS